MTVIQNIIIIALMLMVGLGTYFLIQQKKARERAEHLLMDQVLFLEHEAIPILERSSARYDEDMELSYLYIAAQEQAHRLEDSVYAPTKPEKPAEQESLSNND